MNTFILEDSNTIDFGEAQTAYDNYPEVKQTFLSDKSLYKGLIEEMSSKGPETIMVDDIQKIDNLYKNLTSLKEECREMKANLIFATDNFINKSKKTWDSLKNFSSHIDEEDYGYGKKLFTKVLELKENHADPVEGIEKAREAMLCLKGLLDSAHATWIGVQNDKFDSLNINQ